MGSACQQPTPDYQWQRTRQLSEAPLLCCRYTYKVPRVHTGGQYTITYTDERGQQTSVTFPAPERELALTSPAAHAHLPIPPQGGTVTVAYAIPEILFAQPPMTPATPAGPGQVPATKMRAEVAGQCKQEYNSLPATGSTVLAPLPKRPT